MKDEKEEKYIVDEEEIYTLGVLAASSIICGVAAIIGMCVVVIKCMYNIVEYCTERIKRVIRKSD